MRKMTRRSLRVSRAILILLLCLLVAAPGCGRGKAKLREQDLSEVKSIGGGQAKTVIFLMADSLMFQAIDRGIRDKSLPAFQYLIDHGQYYRNLVSSFPTMSVTIDSSLLTGAYPDKHRVPGLIWFSAADKRIVNYGTGPMEVLRQGTGTVLEDALIRLNGEHLNPRLPTLYEELARRGLTAGSVNGLIYRGTHGHTLNIPAWIHWPTKLPKRVPVKGPEFLALGVLANPLAGLVDLPEGPTGRMGVNNSYSVKTLNVLIRSHRLPDFLYVYLPDLDKKLHKHGPSELDGVKETDRQLQSVLQAFGSPEEALKKAVFVIAGDSGMTQIRGAGGDSKVDLPSLFKDYRILRPGETATDRTELILAVNETMAYVYKWNTDKTLRQLAGLLSADPRIDFAAWREGEWVTAMQAGTAKELRFKAGGELIDPYRQKWAVEADPGVLDLRIDRGKQTVGYGRYPDALRRLYASLHSHEGDFLIVTAKPGYELADRSSPTHRGGGGHGALGMEESLVPLIVSGTDRKPQYMRMVDLKPFLLELLSGKRGEGTH